jgi:hypothetical protein
MTYQSPRIYLYKITFEEVSYYYYGVKKERWYNEEYWGSPVTHKWCWNFYTPKKQILEVFPYTDEGWIEAQEVETRLIRPFYNTDKWCLNENCGGIISLDVNRNTGKISGKKQKKLGIGIHGRTKEQMAEDGKKGGKKLKELGLGVHGRTKEQMMEDGKKGGKISGKKIKELGIGIHGRTKEQMMEDGKKGGKKLKELGLGVHGRTKEQIKKDSKKGGKKGGKKTSSQKWKCLETGFITNPGNLTKYQNARGIDTSKRVRIL